MTTPMFLVEPVADVAADAELAVDVDVTDLEPADVLITRTAAEWKQIEHEIWETARLKFLGRRERREKREADEAARLDAEAAVIAARLDAMEHVIELALIVANKPARPAPTPARTSLFQMSNAEREAMGPVGIRNLLTDMWAGKR